MHHNFVRKFGHWKAAFQVSIHCGKSTVHKSVDTVVKFIELKPQPRHSTDLVVSGYYLLGKKC